MRAVEAGLAAVLSLAVVGWLQFRSGAYQADFDATEDEPAHVVTSLMVHDYLVSGRLRHPWEFATAYYIHYPKVAMLHWPPVFHLAEAIWMLAAQRSRAALLGFQALVGAALVFSVGASVRRDGGVWMGAFAAMLVAVSPPMQMAVSMVSPDILLGALVFWAAIAYGNWWWFWGLTVVALGTHGRAAPLLMFPVLAAIFQRPTLRRFSAVVGIGVVFLVLPRFFGHAYSTDARTILVDGGAYVMRLGAALSWPVLFLSLIGAMVRKEMAALVLSCWIFHAIVNVPLADYFLVTAVPAAVGLAACGAGAIWARGFGTQRRKGAKKIAMGVGLAAIALWGCFSGALHSQSKGSIGARQIASGQRIWLVAGTALFEGAVVAEVALRDRAMEHVILRGSKMLAHSTWNGSGYRMQYTDAASTMGFLDEAHVGWIAIRPDRAAPPHVATLDAALEANARIWQRVASPAAGVELFQRIEPLPGTPKIEIDLRDKLGIFVRLP